MNTILAVCLATLVLVMPLAAQVTDPPEYTAGMTAYTAKEYVKARPLFEKAAAAGHAASMYRLGLILYAGHGVTMDEPAGVAWFRKAAALGDRDAMHEIGVAYLNGYGVPKNTLTAIEWYTKADALGNPASAFHMAKTYDDGNGVPSDKAKAIAFYRRAATLGHTQSMNDLGVMLETGEGTAVNLEEARSWYQKAADADYPEGMFNLGRVIADGIGGPADVAKGIELYEKAVKLGSGDAANNLSYMYNRGEGVEKNRVTARYWAQIGADLGNAAAAQRLTTFGDIRLPGDEEYGLAMRVLNHENDKVKALALFTKAMEKGHMMATAFVAEAYRDGRGVARDDVKGRQLTTRCAEMGNDSCQTILAQLFMRGTGGPVDHEAARKWFETASLKGNTLAMWFLADMYDKGNGIPRNDALASYWYNVAYSKGSPKAEAVLKARGLLVPDPRTQAYLTRIEKEGPSTESVHAFMYEVAVYCKFGGKKCHELTVAGEKFMQSRNASAESANLQRIWNAYAAPSGADDEAWRRKSDCMRKKTESMQRHNSGQQDWYYGGDC